MAGWEVRFEAQFAGPAADPGILDALWAERADWERRHPCSRVLGFKCAPKVHRGMGSNVEQWRPLVAQHFPASEVERALCIMSRESGGNPNAKNPRSSASGLFQHLARYWPDRSAAAGWAGASIWDPEANIAVAAWLQRTGGWGHWSPYLRGHCR